MTSSVTLQKFNKENQYVVQGCSRGDICVLPEDIMNVVILLCYFTLILRYK
jgi:hypothetical protein